MIKVNLLDSVTDRPKGIVDVERELARPRTQVGLVAGVAGVLLLLACVMNYWLTSRDLAKAKAELEEQQRIAAQMAQIKKEKDDLEKKIQAITGRIEAIQRLRASQRGPVAVLAELRDRIVNLPGLFLRKVEQKGDTLVIEGYSPNEDVVARFGSSLEFSSGLFTNLNIETNRNASNISVSTGEISRADGIVGFIIRCNYTPPGSKPEGDAATPTAVTPGAPLPSAGTLVPAPAAPAAPAATSGPMTMQQAAAAGK